MVDSGESIQLLRWASGDASTPPSLAGQCRLNQKLAAIFADGPDVYGVPHAQADRLLRIPVTNGAGGAACGETPVGGRLPSAIYVNRSQPIPGGGNISLPSPANYAAMGGKLFYSDEAAKVVLGVSLPDAKLLYNKTDLHSELDYESLWAGDDKTLLMGNRGDNLRKIDAADPAAPTASLKLPNASGGLWAAAGGVVVYETRNATRPEAIGGWAASDLQGNLLAYSPPLTNVCNKPAYSCMMNMLTWDPHAKRA